MNRIILPALLLGGLLVAAPGASSSARAPDKPSYPMVCRGGGSISSTLTVNRVTDTAQFEFKKGSRSAESGLAPGECSWLDRGMRDGEPDVLIQYPDRPPKKIDAGWIKELQVPGGYWMFSVFNDGNRLVVTDSKPYKRMPDDSSRPAPVPRAEADRADITRTETVRVPSGVKPGTTSGAMRPGAAAAVGGNAEVAPAADFPMFVAANSGKIVFLADMNGGGWNDYVRERALSLSVDDSGILYYADTTQFLTRENRLGGPPQRIDMRVPIIDFKFDSAGGIVAVSSQENCVVRMNDIGGGGFIRFGSKGSGDGHFNVPQGVALDSKNRIYIADTGNHRILRMDDINGSGWAAFGSYGGGAGHFNSPWRIWVDKRDRIYVVDMYNARIVRLDDMDGSGWVTYGGFVSPRFVTTDKFNRIYVADPEADQVIRIDDMTGKGKKILQFRRDTSSAEALNKPGSLAGPAAIYVLRPAQGADRIR
ncbi:MAG TPA: NHL repeat-containing protein [Blastocatellia bacterium]|nr:NHL repeat-containing protein [Blastocatellia bacterium]